MQLCDWETVRNASFSTLNENIDTTNDCLSQHNFPTIRKNGRNVLRVNPPESLHHFLWRQITQKFFSAGKKRRVIKLIMAADLELVHLIKMCC